MIDWDAPDWGGHVHGDEQAPLFVSSYARLVGDPRVTEDSHGSWLDGEGTSRRVLRGSGSFLASLDSKGDEL